MPGYKIAEGIACLRPSSGKAEAPTRTASEFAKDVGTNTWVMAKLLKQDGAPKPAVHLDRARDKPRYRLPELKRWWQNLKEKP